jgi:hypothetical protein
VGNKSDLLKATLDLSTLLEKESKNEKKRSVGDKARYYEQQLGLPYFQISTKCSTKQQIEAIFVELINKSEVFKFIQPQDAEGAAWWSKYLPVLPCSEGDKCTLY